MKLKANQIAGFVRKPDPNARAVLVFGPDHGLVRERTLALAKTVVDDVEDAFRVAVVRPESLKETPSLLADEAAAIPLTGGRRLVWVRGGAPEVAEPLETYLEAPVPEALVLIEAGDLGSTSPLRKAVEQADNAVAVPCYADDSQSLEGLIRETLRANDLAIDREALAWLEDHLGSDRLVTRQELEKLVLYMGAPGTVRLADAMACVGDSAAVALEDLAYATAGGDQEAAQAALDRVYQEGTKPVPILRAVARHLQRLHEARAQVDAGRSPEQAVSGLKPPVFFKRRDAFLKQVKAWRTDRLGTALDMLLRTEMACKRTGTPDMALCGRTLMQIARAARSGR